MSLKKKEVIGEGGVHRHNLSVPEKTDTDGIHKHLFLISDRLLMTDLSGAHDHDVDLAGNGTGPERQPHEHVLNIQTQSGLQQFPTKNVTPHSHELQTSSTTLSGLHTHEAEIGEETFLSLLPGDLLDEIEQATKLVPGLKDFNVWKSDDPMEMNFQLVKRLNQKDFKEILKTAGMKAVIKGLERLSEGFQIESLILSRERFSDIGLARRFVMDHGFEPKSSLEGNNEDSNFVFQISEHDKFDSSTLSRIHITDGVVAVIGLLSDSEKTDDVEAPKVVEGAGSDALTENATEVQQPTLSERFANLKEQYGAKTKKSKKKSKKKLNKKIQQKFLFLKTGKELKGSVAAELEEIAEAYDIDTKYVTIEYPQKRFIEILTTKYEVISAVYEDLGEHEDESESTDYKSLHVKGEHLEAFIVSTDGITGYKKSLVLFFDDPKHLDDIFKTTIKNYPFGAYQFKQTMMGPILIGVENDNTDEPILDQELLDNLSHDTKTFFSKESEDFFAGKNPAKKVLPYKRGILMYGPPGNGKTTFIKYFAENHVEDGYAVLCESQDFCGTMGKFLKQVLGRHTKKVIIFEDVDAIAHDYCRRSEFLNFLDGVNTVHKTLFIATTNYPQHLDDALIKRPSRFDQKYYIGFPDVEMRSKFLKVFFPDVSDADITVAIQETEGFSGASFKELFILTGLQKISLSEAIVKFKAQMVLHKIAPITLHTIADIVWNEFLEPKLNDILSKDLTQAQLADLVWKEGIGEDEKEETLELDEIQIKLRNMKAAHGKKPKGKKKIKPGNLVKKNLGFFDILKADEDKRLVTGPILLPEKFDLQNDIISGDEITKGIHNYMVKLAFQGDLEFLESLGLSKKSERGFMHQEFSRKIAFVEMFVVDDDRGFMMMNKRKLMNGTAVGVAKVFDDEVWALIKSKKINGFSIGGRSQVVPA